MPSMRIVLDADGAFRDDLLKATQVIHVTEEIAIGALQGGMQSGKTSVVLVIPINEGKVVVVETSLALLVSAARAFVARYGDPMAEQKPAN